MRLDRADGAEKSRSEVLGDSELFTPRLTVDGTGAVYLANGWDDGVLWSFDADLALRWAVKLPQVSVSQALLTDDGVLVVDAAGLLRAYATLAGTAGPISRVHAGRVVEPGGPAGDVVLPPLFGLGP